MTAVQLFFSIAFFTIFAIYFFFGLYTLFLNPKSTMNRVFFILCMALCVWSFAFSISTSAPDYETALLWHRIAAFGWSLVFSLLLHFIIILTEKEHILKGPLIFILLYLPALVVMAAFSLDRSLVDLQYNLVNSPAGWVNTWSRSWLNWLFNAYYAGYTAAGIAMLWKWGRRCPGTGKRHQAYLLIAAFALALVIGTVTDILSGVFLSTITPQIAPVIILIPVTAIFSAIKKYGLLTPETGSTSEDSGRILNEASRIRIYQLITISYIIGSLLNFVARYFIYEAPLIETLVFSGALVLFGVSFLLVKALPWQPDYQDALLLFLISLSIPVVTLNYVEYASITVWVMPVIPIVLSSLFIKRRMIVVMSIFIIATQIAVWMKVPVTIVQVDSSDYIARIGILGITLWLAFYVNQVYANRLEENAAQFRFQKMVSDLSGSLVTVNDANFQEKITHMLKQTGGYFLADHTFFLLLDRERRAAVFVEEWSREGTDPAIAIMDLLPENGVAWWMETLIKDRGIYVPDVDQLPPGARLEQEMLKNRQIRSLLAVPITSSDQMLGLVGFASVKPTQNWRNENWELLKVLSHLLADALAKVMAEREINQLAYYDALTGLPNRTLFSKRLRQAITAARQEKSLVGVIFMDLDSFKSVNDTMGHRGGDELLRQVAGRISDSVRPQDTVSRFGGDEFLIMLADVAETEEIRWVADSVFEAFTRPLIVRGQEFYLTASAGIAIFPYDGQEYDALIKNADLAMYSSKDSGKNQYTVCSPELKEDISQKRDLTNSLYKALERNELVLYYQPQVNVATGQIVGLEALLKWEHPEWGTVSPGVFIPLAEQTGLINSIGEWVLMEACRQNQSWQDMQISPVRMAVNLSVEQFRNPNLISTVEKVLFETGLRPDYLELEITEGIAVKEAGSIVSLLARLKHLGVTIAIDDFGTGYSNLSRLKMLPVDRIKMDMQFVQGIAVNEKDEAIAKVIIQLTRNLGMQVIAEGVETRPQFEFLARQSCDEVQGYYFYRPMPAEAVEEHLKNQRTIIGRNY